MATQQKSDSKEHLTQRKKGKKTKKKRERSIHFTFALASHMSRGANVADRSAEVDGGVVPVEADEDEDGVVFAENRQRLSSNLLKAACCLRIRSTTSECSSSDNRWW